MQFSRVSTFPSLCHLQNSLHLATGKLCTHQTLTPNAPSPQSLETTSLLSISMNLTISPPRPLLNCVRVVSWVEYQSPLFHIIFILNHLRSHSDLPPFWDSRHPCTIINKPTGPGELCRSPKSRRAHSTRWPLSLFSGPQSLAWSQSTWASGPVAFLPQVHI